MKLNIYTGLLMSAVIFPANAVEVSKQAWIDAMSTALPTAFCNSKQYFRQCFNVTPPECVETAASATRVCLGKYKDKIPDVLNQPEDGTHWGSIIGSCAGEAYETVLIKHRIDNEKCSNPANWK
jgi:hypothetical protein